MDSRTYARRFSRRITHHNLPGVRKDVHLARDAADCDAQGKRDYDVLSLCVCFCAAS
jgi:hypothetical protein